MPAPIYSIPQTVPNCAWAFGTAIPGPTSPPPPQPLEIDASCCHGEYGWQVYIGTGTGSLRILAYEDALPAGPGAKTFSTDSSRLCGSTGAAFNGSYSGNGTITGANFSGTGSGTLTGGVTGGISVTITGSFTSPGNGSYTGTITGTINATLVGTIVGGVLQPVVYTVGTPPGVTITGTGGSFTVGGGGNTFTFNATFTGNLPESIFGYYELVWTDCNVGGIELNLKATEDDEVLATWKNEHYSLRAGWKTILNRTHVNCGHPCVLAGLTTERQLFAGLQQFFCFSPGLRQINRP